MHLSERPLLIEAIENMSLQTEIILPIAVVPRFL